VNVRRLSSRNPDEMELDRVEEGVDMGIGRSFGDNGFEGVEGKAARRGGGGEVKA